MTEKDHLPQPLARNPFFKKEGTAVVKYEMLRMEATTKKPVTQVCKEFSYTRKIFYDAKARYENEGMAGLLEKVHGSQTPRKLTDQIEELVVEIKREHLNDPKFKNTHLYEILKERCIARGIPLSIGQKTVDRILLRNNLHIPRPRGCKKNS
jgi:transposase